MEKINFKNNDKPYINADNLNILQNNVETAISDASTTIQNNVETAISDVSTTINEALEKINNKNIAIENEVETDEVVGGKRVYKKRIKFVSGSEGYQNTGLSNCTLINWSGYGYNASGYGISCPGDINMQVENVNKLDRVYFTGAIKNGYTPIITFWYTKEA